MKDLHYFIINCLNFAGLLLVAFLLMTGLFFWKVSPQYISGYDAALIDKRSRLLSIHEPKIILCGNSNVAFGIDSQLIEKEMGMPVVNLGLHGSLGDRMTETLAKENLGEGDIVVLPYNSFAGTGAIIDPVIGWLTIEDHFEMWSLVQPDEYLHMLQALPTYMRKCMMLYIDGKGNHFVADAPRGNFDKYGDIVHSGKTEPERENPKDASAQQGVPSGPDDAFISRMYELNNYCIEKGANLLISAYPIVEGEHTKEKERYKAFGDRLSSLMPCDVISDFNDYRFSYIFFEDVVLHLNKAGAILRSKQLVRDLKVWMKSKDDAKNKEANQSINT